MSLSRKLAGSDAGGVAMTTSHLLSAASVHVHIFTFTQARCWGLFHIIIYKHKKNHDCKKNHDS